MMRDRLYEFFIEDSHARRRCALWSIGIGGAVTALTVIFGLQDDFEIALTSALASSVVFAFQVYLYAAGPLRDPVAPPISVPVWRAHWKLALVTVAISCLTVVESRLRRLIGNYTL